MAHFGFVGDQRLDMSSRRKADADRFLEGSPTEHSTSNPDSLSTSISDAAVTGTAFGTVVGVPVSVVTSGATFSLFTGALLSTGTVNISIAVSFTNTAAAICCVGGFVVLGAVIATGCALAFTGNKEKQEKERLSS
jgi:hypothetical protein